MKTPVILYGTTNPAKLAHMRRMLSALPIEIAGIREIGAAVPDVEETGGTPLENARLKALSCFQALQRPVFACDSGLRIEGLPEAEQPGVHVRMVNGRRLTDAEMTAHYAAIARRMGGKAMARYQNAICLITADGALHEHDGEDISGETFYLVDVPHAKRVPGYPLDCLSVRPDTGQYYNDDPRPASDSILSAGGFSAFFRRALHLETEEGL